MMWSFLLFLVFHMGMLTASPVVRRQYDGYTVEGTIFDTHATIEADGYVAETHTVTTSDGYILQMYRIPLGRGQVSTTPKTPVFLMHGLAGSSSGFVGLGADQSMAYHLADAGYDVWLGNARGNRNSRFHVTLSPDDDEEKFKFFDFTWEEIGIIDLPTMIDYVLENTGHEKLHFIGHSQGGTVFLVLNSMRPEYNEKFLSAHLLAGVGFMEYFPDPQLTTYANIVNIIYGVALSIGIVEVFPPNFTMPELPGFLPFQRSDLDCFNANEELTKLCDVMERDDPQIDDILEEFLGGGAGASVKQYAHYGQNIAAKTFQRWDYGTDENLEVYGSEEPPFYDISLITVNTTMHYTVSDNLLDERDVLAMVEVMPSAVARRVARDSFGHSDFLITDDAKDLVTDFIIEELMNVDNSLLETEEVDVEEVETDPIDVPEPEAVPGSSSMISASVLFKVFLSIYVLGLLK